jgi:hypothetical protein
MGVGQGNLFVQPFLERGTGSEEQVGLRQSLYLAGGDLKGVRILAGMNQNLHLHPFPADPFDQEGLGLDGNHDA